MKQQRKQEKQTLQIFMISHSFFIFQKSAG